MRAEAVGQPARVLAGRAGFHVPDQTRLLIAEGTGVGREHPLSAEKLFPVLAVIAGGTESVSSGSTMATCGNIQGLRKLTFTWCSGEARTAL